MRKIPSLFVRDWDGDRSRVLPVVAEGCEWVTRGEGVATVQWDGTACLVRGGRLFKRYDYKARSEERGRTPPPGWEPCEPERDEKSGHWPGWVPVGDGPEDRWHREAWGDVAEPRHVPNETFELMDQQHKEAWGDIADPRCVPDATYELIGLKVRGNPYNRADHILLPHGMLRLPGTPRFFEGLRAYLLRHSDEGIVWHHNDGRMAKVKSCDLGIPWPRREGACSGT